MLSGWLVTLVWVAARLCEPVECSYRKWAPYRYGERTYGLRVALLQTDYKANNGSMLRNVSSGWYLTDRQGNTLKFEMQGLSNELYQGPHLFARTEDGRWHKFQNNSARFAEFLSELPIQYDDIKALACDEKEWFVRNNYGEWRKFVRRGEIEAIPGRVWGMDEDGLWYAFKIEPGAHLWRFRAFLIPLPATENYLNYLEAMDEPEKLIRCQDNDTVMRSPCAPPTFGLREYLTKRRLTPVEDNQLVEQNGSWYVREPKGGLHKLEMQGFGLEKNEYNFILRSEDKVWHKFRRVPRAFRHFVTTLPEQHDRSEVVYDGKDWYGREKYGSYAKITLTDLPWDDTVQGRTSIGTKYDFYKMPQEGLMLEEDKNGTWCILSMFVEEDYRKLIRTLNVSAVSRDYLVFIRTTKGPVLFARDNEDLWHKMREVPKKLHEFVTRLRQDFGPNGVDFCGKTWVDHRGLYVDFTVKLKELTASDIIHNSTVNGTHYKFYYIPKNRLVPHFYNITNWKRIMWSHELQDLSRFPYEDNV